MTVDCSATMNQIKQRVINITALSVVLISPTRFVHNGSSTGYSTLKTHISVSGMLVEILINKTVIKHFWFYDTT